MDFFSACLLAVVEGLTEYLPISSTGHIILASALLGIESDAFVKDFTVMVQFGAILSVVVVYWRRFFQSLDFYKKLCVAFLPAGVIGLLVKNRIDVVLGSVEVVAWGLVLGGIVLLWMERKPVASGADIGYRQAFWIGLIQCCAFFPGVSRSGATIVGGLLQGLNRTAAAEFSFFLAVPTLAGAGFLKLLKSAPTLTAEQVQFLVVGNVVSFLVGWLTIKTFIHYLTRFGFAHFAWYRMAVGFGLLVLIYSGFSLRMI